ncbi:MAG: DUF4406 domain-containing protein [Bacteroidales bacterium]|jgi:hypothetical protein|nr:DUF4406 domain-containing protein [Bacteroidales bacterium]
MKIYIAGKITNYHDYKNKFTEAEKELTALGHTVMNPSVLPEGLEQHEYMKICYSMIDVCEGVFMLDNWLDSVGAGLEHEYAKANQKTVMYQAIRTEITT